MTIRSELEDGYKRYGNVPIMRTLYGEVTYHTFETVDQAYDYLRTDVMDVIEHIIEPGEELPINVVGTTFTVKKLVDNVARLIYATGR